MYRFQIVLFFILMCSNVLNGQNLDTNIFENNFEKQVFLSFENDMEIDYLSLFICNKSINLDEFNQEIGKIIKHLNSLGVIELPIKKKIKIIHKTIHEDYLKKYVEESYFWTIFRDGDYNCVTASALYALIFEYYNITYKIKETPNHVYLIAQSGKKETMIETLLVKKGIVQYDDRFKKNFIEYLHSNKIVSDYEIKSLSLDTLFNRHYSKDKTINIQELAGLHYFNMGFFEVNRSEFEIALKKYEKAEILYPNSTAIKYMKNIVLEELLKNNNAKKKYDGVVIAKYLNTNPQSEIAYQAGLDFFKVASNELMVNRPNIDLYNKVYSDFINTVSDSISTDEFKQVYHLLYAYVLSVNYKLYETLSHLRKAYGYNSENIQIRQSVTEIAGQYLFSNDHDVNIDSIEYYMSVFPFLEKDRKFSEYLLYSYGASIIDKFEKDYTSEGLEYLNKFENLISKNQDLTFKEEIVVTVYGGLSEYYIKNMDIEKARHYLTRGLELVPNQELLKEQIYRINKMNIKISSFVKGSEVYKPTEMTIDDKKTVNRMIKDHLKKCWYSEKEYINGDFKKIPLSERGLLIFESKKYKFIEEKSDMQGSWSYDTDKCIITIYSVKNGYKRNLYIKVLEMDSTTMKVMIVNDYNHLTGELVYFKACK